MVRETVYAIPLYSPCFLQDSLTLLYAGDVSQDLTEKKAKTQGIVIVSLNFPHVESHGRT